MGIRGSPTAELTFDSVSVPAENRLGEEGEGFAIAMRTFERSRPGIAAQAVGIAQGALDEATRYSRERIQFGRPIGDLQMIQALLADMAAQTEAARALLYRACAEIEHGPAEDAARWAAMCKLDRRGYRHEGRHGRRPGPGRIRLYRRLPRRADDA